MTEVTKAHRLSVARAWEGDNVLTREARRWIEDGTVGTFEEAGFERLAQLVADAEGAWIPCEERMPDHSDLVLVTEGSGPYIAFREDGAWCAPDSAFSRPRITHWRHLPKPPDPT